MEAVTARKITNNIISLKEKIDFLMLHLTKIRELSAQTRLVKKLLYDIGNTPETVNDEKELIKIINFTEGLKRLMEKNQEVLLDYLSYALEKKMDEYEKKQMNKAKDKTDAAKIKKILIGERRDLIYERINSIISCLKTIKDIVLSSEKKDYPKIG